MPKFMFAYHGGGVPETPEEGEKVMAAWMSWMQELGEAIVDPGNPVGLSSTLTKSGLSEGGGANPLSGYTIVQADTLDAAAEMGKGCPILDGGNGSIEIAEIHEM
ncbi:hypothetical protein PGB28_13660 [Primorskyibacter aestuariivivens]|uniref:hypothetical protein n=1 Tax=Primorskyibacter aestuariivivens TaxID=1888912 RepID=UPI0023000180|nr:hypothetical protein [Primorskyibacter aestuariivivens]MDA7429511.1 hypothetical protein [Primorskyibacter aestuariivivens]